jgi:hypothetical protein
LAPPPVHTVAHSLTGEALPNADNNTEESEKERPVGLLSLLDGEKSDA